MQTLTILRGLPGAGKSTFAALLSEQRNTTVIVEADDFFMVGDEYVFDPLKLKEAHADCLARAKKALEEGYSVIVANTNSRHWEFEEYIKYAEEKEIFTFVVLVEGNHGSTKPLANPEKTRMNMKNRWEPYAW
jgi:predicted kinase